MIEPHNKKVALEAFKSELSGRFDVSPITSGIEWALPLPSNYGARARCQKTGVATREPLCSAQ